MAIPDRDSLADGLLSIGEDGDLTCVLTPNGASFTLSLPKEA